VDAEQIFRYISGRFVKQEGTFRWHTRYLIIYSNFITKFPSTPKRKQPQA